MTKVCIVSGFLGAGKTTFIKELIEKVFTEGKVVLIENEFGEIAVDSRFMQNSGIEVTEMNSGCICCTLVGDFARSLKQVVEEYQPDRIIIEPSGVGKLSDVAAAVEDLKSELAMEVDSKITVVDGKKTRLFMKNFGEFFNNQIENATTIVVSRTQLMKDDQKQECLTLLKGKNPDAAIITTPWEQLSGEMIQSALNHGRDLQKELLDEHHHDRHDHEHGHSHEHHHHDHDAHDHDHHHHKHDAHDHDHHHHDHDAHDHDHHHHDHDAHDHDHHHHDHCGCGCDHDHHDHHHADEIFTSWGIETARTFNLTALKSALKELSDSKAGETILRAKGILEGDNGQWFEFDLVPGEVNFRACKPDYIGRLCVIGTELDEDHLKKIFEGDA